jgi:hypothetical protein
LRSDRHGVADVFIGLETSPALFGTRKNSAVSQIAIGMPVEMLLWLGFTGSGKAYKSPRNMSG